MGILRDGLVVRWSKILTQRPCGCLIRSRMLTIVLAIPLSHTHFQGKTSNVWDSLGRSPRQAVNRALMNHLGRVGSDTGIRTRICALRGHRPNP
jgi:hypothetical protein